MRHITHFITRFPGLSRGSAQRFLSTTRARRSTTAYAVSHSRRRLFATLSPSGTLRRFCAAPIVSFCPASPVSPQAFSTRGHCVPGVPRGAASHALAAAFSSSTHQGGGVRRPPLSEHGQALAKEFVDKDRVKHRNGDADRVGWERDKHLDKYAAELLVLHEGSLELEAREEEARQAQEEGDGGDKGNVPKQAPLGLDVGATSSNGRVTHVGHGVFIEDHTLGIDADSTDGNPQTITRRESRDVVHHTLGLLRVIQGPVGLKMASRLRRVAVVGHPGIGKTRGILAYTLQELLWRGEVVMRVGYKMGDVHLFVPDEEGQYRVWCSADTDIWAKSVLAGDVRTFVLIDPPEARAGMYSDACGARMIKFASNNAERHYRNFYKGGHVVFTSMPTVDEVVAMIPALWTDATPFADQQLSSAEEKEEEVRKRCAMVDCSPRVVFNASLFHHRLTEISNTAVRAAVDEEVAKFFLGDITIGTDSVGSDWSSMYLLDAHRSSRRTAFARLHPIAAVVLRDSLMTTVRQMAGSEAFSFEALCARYVHLVQDTWVHDKHLQGVQPRLLQPSDQAETLRAIKSLELQPHTVVVASRNFPLLDFATSKYDWFNVVNDDTCPSVQSSALVDVLVKLGMACEENGKLVLTDKHADATITLELMCNSAKEIDASKVLQDTSTKDDGASFESVEEVWRKNFVVKSVDMSDWGARLDEVNKLEDARTRSLWDGFREHLQGLPMLRARNGGGGAGGDA